MVLTVSAIVDIESNTILVFTANVLDVTSIFVNGVIVIKIIRVVLTTESFVFLATNFTWTASEEGNRA